MNIALTLKEIRKERGISQTQFAKDLGISRGALVNYEKGTRFPPIEVLIKVSKIFDIDIDTLISDKQKKDTYYTISNEDAMLIKDTNLADSYIVDENKSDSLELFINFLNANGYPVKDLTDEQLAELYKTSKEFFSFEFFKLGYIKVVD